MSTTSETPDTDELERSMREQYDVARECGWPEFDVCDIADFARKLERERDEARAELARSKVEAALNWQACDSANELHAENEKIKAGMLRIAIECNCRAEHGAEGAEHLLAIEKMLRELI